MAQHCDTSCQYFQAMPGSDGRYYCGNWRVLAVWQKRHNDAKNRYVDIVEVQRDGLCALAFEDEQQLGLGMRP